MHARLQSRLQPPEACAQCGRKVPRQLLPVHLRSCAAAVGSFVRNRRRKGVAATLLPEHTRQDRRRGVESVDGIGLWPRSPDHAPMVSPRSPQSVHSPFTPLRSPGSASGFAPGAKMRAAARMAAAAAGACNSPSVAALERPPDPPSPVPVEGGRELLERVARTA
eukprot:Hpha_TRINITY_DN31550_c0_g1::TRINITY_DN31550_c0_g1_i1::g.1715::m.1715